MSHVELILRESIHGLGEAGEVVRVKPGYARNYLLPQGKAMVATEDRVREVEHHKRVVAEKLAKQRKELEALKGRIEALRLEMRARVGEEGKLFGSVTAVQIGDQLAAQGIEVDRRRIELAEPIKTAGEHEALLRLQGDLNARIRLVVVAEE